MQLITKCVLVIRFIKRLANFSWSGTRLSIRSAGRKQVITIKIAVGVFCMNNFIDVSRTYSNRTLEFDYELSQSNI